MKIKIMHRINPNVKDNEINIILESSKKDKRINDIVEYMKHFKKEFVVKKESKLIRISYDDIISFYSRGKENYCQTKHEEYKIKSRLYEVESLSKEFVRISKNCIININHVECFDMSESGKIIIKLDNKNVEKVSRRRIRDILDYLDERSI